MAIEFECPTCGGTLQVGDETAGRVIRCGGCLTMLRVPAVDSSSPTVGTAAPVTPPSPFETAPLPPRQRPASPTPVQPPPDKPRRRRRDPNDPYDDRPRRTRQRPAQSGSYGVFFWLVVLGGVMLFFVVACCGGLLLMMPGPKWHTHESKPGGFKVELPAKAQPDITNAAGVQLEKNEHAEGTVLLRRVEHFVIIYRDMPSTKDRAALPKGRTDEEEMKQAIKELLAATEVAGQAREEQITVGGFPACELQYQGKAGWYTARIIVADTRLYIVFAGGVEPLGSPEVHRFLNSFTITEPKLVAEGKRREEKAKQAKEREEKVKRDKDKERENNTKQDQERENKPEPDKERENNTKPDKERENKAKPDEEHENKAKPDEDRESKLPVAPPPRENKTKPVKDRERKLPVAPPPRPVYE